MAALVVLLGALAPTVSRWLNTSAGLPVALMEICVTRDSGASTLVLKALDVAAYQKATGEAPESPSSGINIDHCPFCLIQGDGHGMAPPMATASLPWLPRRDHVPALFLHAPHPMPAWAPSLARAPPSLFA